MSHKLLKILLCTSQVFDVKPGKQLHVKESPIDVQTPPFKHGLGIQRLSKTKENIVGENKMDCVLTIVAIHKYN